MNKKFTKDWPKFPKKVIWIMLVSNFIFFLLTPPGKKDENQLSIALSQLTNPTAHGVPLLKHPNPKAAQIRLVMRFEFYSEFFNRQNGYTKVQMNKDKAIGWLPDELVHPRFSKSLEKLKYALKRSADDFIKVLKQWNSILSIIIGIIFGILLHLIIGNPKSLAFRIIDYFDVIVAAFFALGTQVTVRSIEPFSESVTQIEMTYARGCIYIQYALPSAIAASIVMLLFTKRGKIKDIINIIEGLIAIFLLYLMFGAVAGWWL